MRLFVYFNKQIYFPLSNKRFDLSHIEVKKKKKKEANNIPHVLKQCSGPPRDIFRRRYKTPLEPEGRHKFFSKLRI